MLSAMPDGTPIIDLIKRDIEEKGYEIVEDIRKLAILDASEFDVPQSRKRVILVGLNKKYFENENRQAKEKVGYCKNCGIKLVMIPKHKSKVFCSDKCRITWWKEHSSEMQHRNMNVACCGYCKNEFNYYGKRQRKYCSRECYLNAINKGGVQDE